MGLDSGIFNIILLITATWNLCPSVLLITPKHVWYLHVFYLLLHLNSIKHCSLLCISWFTSALFPHLC